MKNHASSRANKGATTFGTPHGFRANVQMGKKNNGPVQKRGNIAGGVKRANMSFGGGRGR